MEYFRLTQDPEFFNALVIPDVISKIERRYVIPEEAHRIKDITVFKLDGNSDPEFIDLVDRQLFMISSQLKEVFQMYVPKLPYKTVIVVNSKKNLQSTYHLPIFKPLKCMSDKSVLSPDKKSVKHLILKQTAIGNHAVFKVQHEFESMVIARLDAAESILRRNMSGIKLLRVELD